MTTITSKPISGEKITTRKTSLWPWGMLLGRTGMFAGVQALFALGFTLAGTVHPWEASANWWPFTVTMTNVVYVLLLVQIFRAEGKRFWDIFQVHREHVKGDLLALVLLFVLMAPISYFPNVWLGGWLFGSPEATLDLLVRPLPMWAAYASIFLFPITQGLAEIPTYFGVVMPRLEGEGLAKWAAISLPALMLGVQHVAVPLLFDVRYIAWRGLMFIPCAFSPGCTLYHLSVGDVPALCHFNRPGHALATPLDAVYGGHSCADGYVVCGDGVECRVLVPQVSDVREHSFP